MSKHVLDNSPNSEAQRLATVVAGIELLAVLQSTAVVHVNGVSALGLALAVCLVKGVLMSCTSSDLMNRVKYLLEDFNLKTVDLRKSHDERCECEDDCKYEEDKAHCCREMYNTQWITSEMKEGQLHVRSRGDVLKSITSNARYLKECCQQRQEVNGRRQDPLWSQ